ncbi:RloB family protein [Streptosporangium sp. NPDC000563]|uniref:RloB family protein n=1 Tax=unclassified Streptosporangium TaxID=2632669 RepID=UPI00331CC422
MSLRSRNKPLKRTPGNLPGRKRFLVYCEGEVTERVYLGALVRDLRIPGVRFGSTHGEPLGLVRAALDHKRRAPNSLSDKKTPYDQVWCVIDVEAPTPHGSLEQALVLARQNNIKCAISNPCFELWLILHVKDQRTYLTTDEACASLEAQGGCAYTRNGKSFEPTAIMRSYELARKRAQTLEEAHKIEPRPAKRNPFTSVWELVDSLRAQM